MTIDPTPPTTPVGSRDRPLPQPHLQPGPVTRFLDAVIRGLPAITLCAVLTITASAEFELARTVLALPPHIAWALPVAIDSYVLAALRSGRDVLPAMGVMAGALTASMAAHLASNTATAHPGAHAGPQVAAELPRYVVAPAATAIMVVLVVVAWRVHVLIGHPAESAASAVTDAAAPVPGTGAAPRDTVETGAPVEMPDSTGALPGTPVPDAAVPASTPGTASAPTEADGVPGSADAVPAGRRPGSEGARRLPVSAVALARAPQRVSAHTPPAEASAAAETSRSDSQLVTAILTADRGGQGELPSIRALKRRYGVGTARASRLHAQATEARQAGAERLPTAEEANGGPQNDEPSQNHDDDQSAAQPGMQETAKENSVSSEETRESEVQSGSDSGEAQGIEEQKPHTCITDRVGPPPASGESAAALSDPEYRAISDAAGTARKPLAATGFEAAAVRAGSTGEAGETGC